MRRTPAISVILCLLACPFASADEKGWIEVRSPNFRVLTNGSVGQGRRVTREFEQMHAVFAIGFPKMRFDSGAPLVILAPRDEFNMKSLAPARFKGSAPKPAGFFQHGWERQYAIVRLDQDQPGSYNVVYHEYVHAMLHANFQWLPTWLDEGMAEFYGNTRFDSTKMYVGAPSRRVLRLRNATLIQLDELISENPWSKYRNDETRIDLFYSEAWALVHYLIFGQGMENGKKLERFYRQIQQGADQKKAFQEVFGNFDEVEKSLREYTAKFAFSSYVLDNPPQIVERDFPSRVMSPAETDAEIGTYRLWSHDREEARASIDQALKDDGKLALAHETLGFLDFVDGKDDDAKAQFAKAYELEPQRYLSLFYKTMLAGLVNSSAPSDVLTLRTAMYDVLKLNPRFAPALVELALANTRRADWTAALPLARHAEDLEPTRAGYHVLVAKILLELGRNEEVAKQVAFVAERWHGPDRDEAMEVWSRIPADKRPANVPSIELPFPDSKATEGTVLSTACGEKGQGTTVVVQNSDGTLTFRSGTSFLVGFSDTIWYGTDHFSVCHHLDGMRAIVKYKASANKDLAGEWVELELRRDFPIQPGNATTPADTKSTTSNHP
jgi:tetratricopeptide (TPR) repeat protein